MAELIIPTEPVPVDVSTPMTYAQGERLIQLTTDLKTSLVDVVTGSPNPTGITKDQADLIIQYLDNFQTCFMYASAFFIIWWVIRWLYRFFGGTLFGGL